MVLILKSEKIVVDSESRTPYAPVNKTFLFHSLTKHYWSHVVLSIFAQLIQLCIPWSNLTFSFLFFLGDKIQHNFVRMEKETWHIHLEHLHNIIYFFSKAELAVWGECNNRRTSLYYFGCNTSLSASEGKIRTQREETWCLVHGKILSKFIFGKFIRTILISTSI